MQPSLKRRYYLLTIFRRIARVFSILFIILILGFLLGDEIDPGKLSDGNWIGLLYFPIGVIGGLIIAWKHELIGGTISLLCLWIFYLLYPLTFHAQVPHIVSILIFSLPAILFLVSGIYGYLAIGILAKKSNED